MVNNVYSTSGNFYSISRNELIAWVNSCLQTNLTKIEEMCTGAAYAQLTDMCFRGKIPLKRIKWNSKHEIDWISNWKTIQTAWKNIGIDKPIPVDSLLKGKFQDNFEFLQWFKKFFDANYDETPYNAEEARGFEPIPAPNSTKSSTLSSKGLTSNKGTGNVAKNGRSSTNGTSNNSFKESDDGKKVEGLLGNKQDSGKEVNGKEKNDSSIEDKKKIATLVKEVAELTDELQKMSVSLLTMENERDYYYRRLKMIEIMMTDLKEDSQIEAGKIKKILYTDDDQLNGEGNDYTHEDAKTLIIDKKLEDSGSVFHNEEREGDKYKIDEKEIEKLLHNTDFLDETETF
uniref:Calponin-homology (CH) domain-containing protein n=1 Tax=Strongyloides stercoralis TaxID=6248 RepID=A0A0K0EPM9_STRER